MEQELSGNGSEDGEKERIEEFIEVVMMSYAQTRRFTNKCCRERPFVTVVVTLEPTIARSVITIHMNVFHSMSV
jgi:hypothetical protein